MTQEMILLYTIRERAQKFIDKVDSGKARSTETYEDMKKTVTEINDVLKELGEDI